MRKIVRHFFFNRLTFSLIAGFLLYAVLFHFLNKFSCKLHSLEPNDESVIFFYKDLDHDGNSESIRFQQYEKITALIAYTDNKIIDQWNFDGIYANTNSLFFGDYDRDEVEEVFVFTLYNDTIFMHCIDVINKEIEFENKAVCRIYKAKGVFDFSVHPCSVYDVTNDDIKEVFFSIHSQFATRPRNLFAYYPKADTFLVSPESCAPFAEPKMFDIDKDGIPEFFSSTLAVGNCRYNRKYTDQYCWLMVFTPQMQFKFPPLRLDGYPASSQVMQVNINKKAHLLVLHIYRGNNDISSFIALYNSMGELVRKSIIDIDEEWYYSYLFNRDNDYNQILLLKKNGDVYRIDSLLQLKRYAKLNNIRPATRVIKKDVDDDGNYEFIFFDKSMQRLKIYRNDLTQLTTIDFDRRISSFHISVIRNKNKPPLINLETGDYKYYFSYGYSYFYRHRILILVILLTIVYVLVFLVKKLKEFRKLKFASIHKQITELQIKAIQNQLNPHFTFNIIESFGNLINEQDVERANYLFNKYVRMLKTIVLNSGEVYVSLREELDFVSNYLDLQVFRFKDKFTHQVVFSESINMDIPVPKMLIHLFVENAIKHGLKHLHSGGVLQISGKKNNGEICVSVKDNGVGREKAKEYNSYSTGKGLQILDQILENYYQLNKSKISYQIVDLHKDNEPVGTEVIIKIPAR